YSAMTGANLKAVDRVVRIVRELDRYHVTFAPAGRRLPGASDREAPAEGTAAYGAALICRAQFAPGDSGDIEFEQNMQLTLSPLERGEGWGEGLGRLAGADARQAAHPSLLPVNGEKGQCSTGDNRPENSTQDLERLESSPGIATGPVAR